ncbi:echinoderm microtubule-associated protein-like 6 [Xenia sp. Carnegie-2017]|uniref:echinoderm microtubule-associated protein-like 6 n=1 Tax=Xenia sp. Carnegie-2017 TaxID=2897299 RepID=UPI001F0411FF|nr:echinoderm microtubule-associated protein-like 6 [Xenia sp. Carnegie-2017]
MSDRTAPRSQLRLEWVYGYRGHQCRNNLYFTASKDLVYFVAGVGIVYNLKGNTQRFFLGHNDDIICLALHPEKQFVATGQVGKDPYICVWDTKNCKNVSILKDAHQQGVASLSFNASGNNLASVGLEDYHLICIWDWKRGKLLASVNGHSDRVFDLNFNPNNDNQMVSCGVKHIKFWKWQGNSLKPQKGIFGKGGEIQTMLCVVFGLNGIAYAGTLAGDIYKWEKNNLVGSIHGHQAAVFTIHKSTDGFATGSKDGSIILWDNNFKVVTKIDLVNSDIGYKGLSLRSVCWSGDRIIVGTNDSEILEVLASNKESARTIVQGHAEGELWALAVHPKKTMFATGSDDCSIRLWSFSDRLLLARIDLDHMIRSLAFHPDGSQIAGGLSNGSFIVLKTRDLSEILRTKDRNEVIHELKYSPDGAYLAVGSNDNFVDIYATSQRYKKVGECRGNSSFITHLDWSEDSKYIQTNSGAVERLFFKIPAGKRVTNKEEIKEINWATWTGVLGTEVNGIWGKYTDTNDVNAIDTSFRSNTLVSGDDFGLVKLFRFPCVKKGAHFRKYIGHSAHVTNVRFSHDYGKVITTGGADHSIFQWQFYPDGFKESGEDLSETSEEYVDSDDGLSDSDASDVGELDSDVENEAQVNYDRAIYKEDLSTLKRKLKLQSQEEQHRVLKSAQNKPLNQGLQLHFVHGYRGYDCHNNLFYLQNGEIIYHVAAVGIVYDRDQHSQRFYLGHTDDILCLGIHPVKDIVATGQVGRDPCIHIWHAENLECLSVLKGQHQRGVCAVDFSGDGKKLASVGLDNEHCIVVWDWKRGDKLATTRGHKDKIFVVKWNPFSSDKLVTVGIKHIKFWTQTGGGFTSKRGIFGNVAKQDTMLCATYGKTADTVYSGGTSGKVFVWEGNTLKETIEAHKGTVMAIQTLEKGFVTGGKDGVIGLWDQNFSRCLKTYKIARSSLRSGIASCSLLADSPPVRAISLGQGKVLVGTTNSEILEIDKTGPITVLIQGHKEGEVWGLAVHPSENICATASDDKTLRVWDLDTHRFINGRVLKYPARSLGYSPDGKAIAIGFKNGSFVVVDASTLDDIIEFQHRKEEISDIKFSPGQGKYLAVASHDNYVDIYNVVSGKRVGVGKGNSSYITHIDWDSRGKLIQSNSGAKEHLFFEAPRGERQVIATNELDKIDWSTWTGVLGREVEGIWPQYSDITDVNATCTTSDKSMIATGDDFGYVKLFQFPAKGKNGKCKKYNGHSAHVTNVRWTHDDGHLVSTGGDDTSVMVWRRNRLKQRQNYSDKTGDSDDSDTDSEEEGGFDSDVELEKNRTYKDKIYVNSMRKTTGTKPHLKEETIVEKTVFSRGSNTPPKVRQKAKDSVNRRRRISNVQDLKLDHVHGYRGFDTRNNVHYLPNGDIVYHTAATGIVLNLKDGTQSFYVEHTDDIISLAVNRHPKFKSVVASGQIGNEPTVHVWDSTSKETLSILQTSHTVGVCSLNFSSSGKLLLTVGVDDNHTLTVWKWSEGTKLACVSGHARRIFVGEFRPDSDTKFVTCGVKHVCFWSVAGCQLVAKRGVLTNIFEEGDSGTTVKMQTMLSVAFAADGVTFTGAMSGDVYVWQNQKMIRMVQKAHNGPVFTLFTTLSDGLIVSGGKEMGNIKDGGSVKLWDQEMKRCRSFNLGSGSEIDVVKSVCRYKGSILVGTKSGDIYDITEKSSAAHVIMKSHTEGEIWGLCTHPEKDVFVTGSDDKTVRLWDLDKKVLINFIKFEVGVRCVSISPEGELIAAGCKNGEFIIMNFANLKIVSRKRDRSKAVQDIRFSPDGRYLAVGSDDHAVDFYELSSGQPLTRVGYCKNIPSFVTQIDFSANGQHVQVSTGSYEKLVFTVPKGVPVTSQEEINNITWASWTSVLGTEVIGIWPKNADSADVNCSNLSHSGNALATGDDFGFVKLFQFPVTEKFAPFKLYIGHSAHVTNVRFSHDDRFLLSTGGDDSSVFVWKCL